MAQERESLERLRIELESSKKKIGSMESRLNTQIQEVEALRKVPPPPTIFQMLISENVTPSIFCSLAAGCAKVREGRARAAGGEERGGRA